MIENYLQNGAKVYFVDKLHIKLYWVERNGAIITSANLTNNALGSKGLYEFGVRLFEFNHDHIEKIIKSLNYIKIELKEPVLEKLKKDYEMFQRNVTA